MMTPEQAQALHERRQAEENKGWVSGMPPHDVVSCWCCCVDCDFDFEEVAGGV